MHWKTMAAKSGSDRLCCNHMRQFLYLHWCPNCGKCDERHCAEPTSSSLVTQTIALDAQMQEQVVNKRWIIQNSVVPAWKQSWWRPPKGTSDWSELAIVLLRPPGTGDGGTSGQETSFWGPRGAATACATGTWTTTWKTRFGPRARLFG